VAGGRCFGLGWLYRKGFFRDFVRSVRGTGPTSRLIVFGLGPHSVFAALPNGLVRLVTNHYMIDIYTTYHYIIHQFKLYKTYPTKSLSHS
jgi:hypothetical protein